MYFHSIEKGSLPGSLYSANISLNTLDARGRWREYRSFSIHNKTTFSAKSMKAKLSLQALWLRYKLWRLHTFTVGSGGLTFLRCSAVSPAVSPVDQPLATLTSKPAFSVLCGLSSITPLVLSPLQPQDCSLPGSCITLLCCCHSPDTSS